jgi:putative transposase
VSRQHHFYGANHLHYLTKSVYRRVRVFDSDRFRLNFIRTLDHLRAELGFKIIGYVLMPEHFHLPILPSELANPSRVLQRLEDRTASFVLKNLRRNVGFPWCQRMLNGLKLLPTVHLHAHHRVWQRGDYDMNIWSEKKRLEKLNYIAQQSREAPVGGAARRLALVELEILPSGGSSVLAMDRMP